jgi:predicted ATPase
MTSSKKNRQIIGLCGGHRVGKTTLAAELARRSAFMFVPTQTSAVFLRHHLRPDMPLDFATRLWIQNEVLTDAQRLWQAQTQDFITDRTPLDFIAYTLADIQAQTPVEFAALTDYINRCFQATLQFFHQLILVQPGIPLVFEIGKAALNQAYIEHLNVLLLGLLHDERMQSHLMVIPRDMLSLQDRCDYILSHFITVTSTIED